jgi:hypothetical protein
MNFIKYTYEEVKNIFDKNSFILLSKEYKEIKSLLDFCDSAGYKFSLSLDSFISTIKNNCVPLKFFSRNPHTLDNIKLWIKINNKPFAYIDGKFKNAITKNLKFYCYNCEKTWTTNWNYLYGGQLCPSQQCLHNRLVLSGYDKNLTEINNLYYLYPEISKEWDYGNNIRSPKEFAPNSCYKANWICSKCGFKFNSKIKNRTWFEAGCHKCNKSRGEKRVVEYLEKNNINFEQQHRIKDCRNKKQLPFDFAITNSYNEKILLEYQGKQHFGVGDGIFGGEESFQRRLLHDNIKLEYCKNNNLKLIVIPYWDYDNIENILGKELSNYLLK